MPRISRPEFLAITDLEVGQLRTLDRRGQLPFAIDQAAGRGYEAGEVFLTLVAQHLADNVHGVGLNVTRASSIAAALPDALSAVWPSIVETGRAIAGGTDTPPEEILAGRAEAASPAAPRAVAGTLLDITAELAASGFLTRSLIVVSASTLMALLIQRADRHGIELPSEFWIGPLRYRPRPAPFTPEEMAAALVEVKR